MEQLGFHWTHCHEIKYLSIFKKFLKKYSFFWVISPLSEFTTWQKFEIEYFLRN